MERRRKSTKNPTDLTTQRRDAMIWMGCISYHPTGKQNDLLFRSLHDRIVVGDDLYWIDDTTARRCPICNETQTVEHLFLTCQAARSLWAEFQVIWIRKEEATAALRDATLIDTTRVGTTLVPRSRAELLGLLAVTPYREMSDRTRHRRYKIMTSALIRAVWKAYTKFQFREHPTFRTDEIVAFYVKQLEEMARRDHTSLNAYQFISRRDVRLFQGVWGVKATTFGHSKPLPVLVGIGMLA